MALTADPIGKQSKIIASLYSTTYWYLSINLIILRELFRCIYAAIVSS